MVKHRSILQDSYPECLNTIFTFRFTNPDFFCAHIKEVRTVVSFNHFVNVLPAIEKPVNDSFAVNGERLISKMKLIGMTAQMFEEFVSQLFGIPRMEMMRVSLFSSSLC